MQFSVHVQYTPGSWSWAKVKEVDSTLTTANTELGYVSLKDKQKELIISSFQGKVVLQCSLLAVGRAYAMVVRLGYSISSELFKGASLWLHLLWQCWCINTVGGDITTVPKYRAKCHQNFWLQCVNLSYDRSTHWHLPRYLLTTSPFFLTDFRWTK